MSRLIALRMARAASHVTAALLLVGCSPPSEFADWIVPVPEGTRLVEYPAVPPGERNEHVELVEDLRLGSDDASEAFYGPRNADADADGNIYVMDAGNHRVQVYDPEGGYLRTIGRRGQGPAEFERPRSLVIAGDRLVVKGSVELSTWTLAGEHVSDRRHVVWIERMYGRSDGLVIANHIPEVSMTSPLLSISAFSTGGEEQFRYVEVPVLPGREPAPTFAAARDGSVYVTAVGEYQVLALAPDGQAAWALRVPWPRLPPDDVESLEGNELEVPEPRLPALSHLAVDGHGHLYVYPYDTSEGGSPIRPVDVYAPTGEHLFSGTIPDLRWASARGEHVFAVVFDEASGEHHVVRYRVIEPF